MIDFDFHTHTSPQSECATQTVEALVKKAYSSGIKILSVCNHDTLDGLSAVKTLCDDKGIEFVNGVELTCDIRGETEDLDDTIVHILGYGIDDDSRSFDLYTAPIKKANEERILNICRYLRSEGHNIDDCTDLKLFLAQLVDKKFFADKRAARHYSYKLEPLFPTARMSHRQAIELIHKLHGIAVWAHPARVFCHEELSPCEIADVTDRFCACGLDGLEIFHPDNMKNPEVVQTLLHIADTKNLAITLGSDSHHEEDKDGYFPLRRELYDFDVDFNKIRYFWKR